MKTIVDKNLEDAKTRAWPDDDFVKSDYCTECGGDGYVWLHHENPLADNEKEQCPSCEELHKAEVRIDRLIDELKGN